MEKNQKDSEENEKAKANALAQSKYNEILAYSVDLEDSLNEIEDWSKASRAEVITGIESQEKWSLSYDNLNKAHRNFKLAISKFPLADITEKVEEIIQKTSDLYSSVTKDVKEQDKQRELYSLVGSEADNVKLPKFGGNLGEDFAAFKSKKNWVPVSDKVEKLHTYSSGQALAPLLNVYIDICNLTTI